MVNSAVCDLASQDALMPTSYLLIMQTDDFELRFSPKRIGENKQ